MSSAKPILLLLIVATFAVACQSNEPYNPDESESPPVTQAGPSDRPVAYLDGKVVTQDQIYRLIAQAHGGEALAEILLNRAIANRLSQEQMQLTDAEIEAEGQRLLESLSSDTDEAARLLQEMRESRGLDATRYQAMLRRNAGLRKLVRDQVTVSETAVQQAYQFRYGSRYQVRLIITDQLSNITTIRGQAINGKSFTDLAIEHSTDSSASQGGLLSPISPVDPTYPKAVRDALPKLKLDTTQSRISPAIALDNGYALLWLENIITKDAPLLEDVRAELQLEVRSELERLRMRQLARTLIEQADVVVLDPSLKKGWERQEEFLD